MSESGFQGKVFVITGAARGMGAETAKLLATRGANVSICDVRQEDLDKTKGEIEAIGKGQVMTTVVDVRDENQVNSWIAASLKKFGEFDGMVNVAGVLGKNTMHKTTDQIDTEDWRFVFDVNVTGMMFCLRAAIPHIKDNGAIVNFASTSGQMGHAMNGAYCASKHAVIGLSRCVGKELGPRGITVNVLSPGPIDTPMMHDSGVLADPEDPFGGFSFLPLKRMGTGPEVAELVAWLLCDKAKFITGTVSLIDGGWCS